MNGPAGDGLLSREGEAALARTVEEGEHAVLRALVQSPVALQELAVMGHELAAGHLRARDILRSAEEGDEGVGETAEQHLADLLQAAGTRLAPADQRHLVEELERARLHRRVLERAIRALRAVPSSDQATQRALEAVEAGRRTADLAKARLVQANLGLVMSFAKRCVGQGLPLHDLIQEGNIGLMRAVDKFDYRRGLRFSTYAGWWIRQQLSRALLDQAKTIRLPVHLADVQRQVRRLQRTFEQAHGRTPSDEELSQASGHGLAKVRAALLPTHDPVSLEAPVGAEQTASLGDFMPDRTTPAPDEAIAGAAMRAEMKRLLGSLTPREQEVLRRRFGLDGATEETLAEIGASLSISRERVRQIEADALRKLRAPSKAGGLETYLGS